jgi:hypothetical protein
MVVFRLNKWMNERPTKPVSLLYKHLKQKLLKMFHIQVLTYNILFQEKISLAPMGALAPGSTHAGPSDKPPINTLAEIFRNKCMGGGGGCGGKQFVKFSDQFLGISVYDKHFSFFSSKKNLKDWPTRGQGGPPIFFYPTSYFFCDLKPHTKFWNPMITLSGIKRKTLKNWPTRGRGVPQFCCTSHLIFFCDLKPHNKFRNPMITFSGI